MSQRDGQERKWPKKRFLNAHVARTRHPSDDPRMKPLARRANENRPADANHPRGEDPPPLRTAAAEQESCLEPRHVESVPPRLAGAGRVTVPPPFHDRTGATMGLG